MSSFFKNKNGSLTLEAAMTMPFFLLFLIFLATMIRIGVAEIALNHAASETAEIIATHVYPAALLERKHIQPTVDTFIQTKSNHQFSLKETKDLLSKGLSIAGIPFTPKGLFEALSAKVLTPIVQNKFQASAGSSFFNKNHVKVDQVSFPNGLYGGSIDMVVEYKMDLFLPFVHKSIILKKRAYEKFWSV